MTGPVKILNNLKPAPGEGRGVAGGFALSLFLHVLALIAIGVIGTSIDPAEGLLFLVPFLALIGIAQWVYIGPAAWQLRRRHSNAIAKGVLIGGGLVSLGSTVCYGGMGLISLQNAAETPRDILKPGVRVAVDYSQERGKPPLSASIVRVKEEGRP